MAGCGRAAAAPAAAETESESEGKRESAALFAPSAASAASSCFACLAAAAHIRRCASVGGTSLAQWNGLRATPTKAAANGRKFDDEEDGYDDDD